MDHFQRRGETLFAEDVSLEEIAERFGTPTYVYSRATIERHVRVLREGMGDLDHTICYAVKANANLGILEVMRNAGSGFDAVSLGELARVAKVGGDPQKTIVSGVGKTADEIAAALRFNALYICVESAEEMRLTAQIARDMGRVAPITVRVNPDVDAQTHPYIATGLRENKFGVPLSDAEALYREALADDALDPCGVSCHIGSQITQIAPFADAARRMAKLAIDLVAQGVPLKHIGIGGGLGIPYSDESPPDPKHYGETLAEIFADLNLRVVLEPGRVIVGNAGILLTRVVRRKRGADRDFLIVDAAMNDLLRPALYSAHHTIVAVSSAAEPDDTVDIVGPVCETGDTFAKGYGVTDGREGALFAVRSAGAYGFAMSSNYNGRPRAAEVLVDGDKAMLIRRREGLADLWRGEYNLNAMPFDEDMPLTRTPEND